MNVKINFYHLIYPLSKILLIRESSSSESVDGIVIEGSFVYGLFDTAFLLPQEQKIDNNKTTILDNIFLLMHYS